MLDVALDTDNPLYTPKQVASAFNLPLERIRMWDKQGLFTVDGPKVGRGGIKKYTFLDALRIVVIAYMDQYNMAKATSGQFADFIANRVRARQKLNNLFGWEESLLLWEEGKNEQGEFVNPADNQTMDAELGVFDWQHWGVKAETREELIRYVHRDIAGIVRDRPTTGPDGSLEIASTTDDELAAPLTDADYRQYCLEMGPLLPRIAIVPIGHIVNSVALHLQPEAFEKSEFDDA